MHLFRRLFGAAVEAARSLSEQGVPHHIQVCVTTTIWLLLYCTAHANSRLWWTLTQTPWSTLRLPPGN